MGLAVLLLWVSPAYALEKIKLGSAPKMVPPFYLPVVTAEDRGFWRENGLDVEWVTFAASAAQMRAIAAGAISIGLLSNEGPVLAAEKGVPVVMVAELTIKPAYSIWVRTDSPYRHPRELKGTRIGVTSLGSSTHIFGRLIAAANGIEKDVRFVGAGGVAQYIAALKTGAIEAVSTKPTTMAPLKVEGVVRELASSADYLPKPWFEEVVFVRKDFASSKPEVVRKILKATVQATDFIRKNPGWAINKMQSFQGISEEAAKLVYDNLEFTASGKLDRKAVENVRRVLIEYGILTEKAPPVDELFTNEFLP